MLSVNRTLFFIGFFLVVPFIYLPLGVVNMKIDDLLMIVLLCFIIFRSTVSLNKKNATYILLFTFFLFYGLALRFYNSVNIYDNYPVVRIAGIILYFIALATSIKKEDNLYHILRGIYQGAIVTCICMFLALCVHMILLGGTINLYSFKDSLSVLGTFNPNSYGPLMVLASFSSYLLYYITNTVNYKKMAVFFLFIPFVFIIKRDMLGIIVGLGYLYTITRGRSLRFLIYLLLSVIVIYATIIAVELWNDPEFILLMSQRVGIYTSAFNSILLNIHGYGIGSEIEIINESFGSPNVTHNSFLSLCLELGIINTMLFLSSLVGLFIYCRKIFIRFYLIIFFVESLFGNGFYFYKYHFIFILISILFMQYYKGIKKV